MTKQELRKLYLQKRLALGDADYRHLNQLLCENFFRHVNLADVTVLHTYLPIEKNKEPDTWLIINRLQQQYPSVKIAVPKINPAGAMENFYLDRNKLTVNTWGIPEPADGTVTDPGAIDLVIVPLLIADRKGHRVGYGKGFYDRFLSQCRPGCARIGLSFFDPVEEIGGLFDHDLPLDGCVTPSGLVKPQSRFD